jgi:hypothetical protein
MNDTPRTGKQVIDSNLNGKRIADRVGADFARELESENARLRAIFPRILEALQSGACTPDCSVEFLEMIPNEVAGIMRKLRMPNVKVRDAASDPRPPNTSRE